VRKRIGWGERRQREGRAYGLLEPTCVAQGSNEAVVGFDVPGIDGDRGAKGVGRLCWRPGCEQVDCALAVLFGGEGGGVGHGFLQDKGRNGFTASLGKDHRHPA